MDDIQGAPSPVGGENAGAPVQDQPVQGTTGHWLDTMPEDIRSNGSLRKFSDVSTLAKSYINAERLIGRDKIPMPQTDEDWENVYSRLGRPETPDKYGFDLEGVKDESLKKSLEHDLKWYAPAAHKYGLSAKQANGLFSEFLAEMGNNQRSQEANIKYEMSVARAQLEQEFGGKTDEKLALATRAMSHFMSPKLSQQVQAAGLGRNPEFIKLLADAGRDYSEQIGIDKSGNSTVTVDTIQDQIQQAQSDPAYMDGTHPNHDRQVRTVQMLYDQMLKIRK